MQHFTHEQILALPHDAYTSIPTKIRIVREGDDEYPWMVDAYNTVTGAYTDQWLTFATFAEAVDAIPYFIENYAPCLSARSRLILRAAFGLLGDGAGHEWDDNSEYTRGIVELVGDTCSLGLDEKDEILALIRQVGER